MKKYLKIAVLVIVVMLLNITNVFAANATVELNADKTQVKVGDTVSVSIVVKGEHGIEALDSTLTYDKTKLELTKVTADTSYTDLSGENASTGEYKLSFIYNGNESKKEATVASLNFKVLDTTRVNDKLEIGLSSVQVNDADRTNDEWITADNTKLTLTVVEAENENPGDSGEKPQEEKPTSGDTGKKDDNKTTDDTQANKKIVYAGLENNIILGTASVLLISIISFIKYKKYKNI